MIKQTKRHAFVSVKMPSQLTLILSRRKRTLPFVLGRGSSLKGFEKKKLHLAISSNG